MRTDLPIGIYEKALVESDSWVEILSSAREAGFDFVEMSIDESDRRLSRLDWSSDRRRELRNAISETGIPVTTLCLSGHRKYPLGSASPATRQLSLDILHKAIDFAACVGIRIIQIAGYFVYYEAHDPKSTQRYEDGLAAGLEWASSAGVMLGIENVDGDDIMSVSRAMLIVEKLKSPWLQVYADIGNLAEHQLDVCAELERGRGHLVGIHVKDTRPGEPRRVPFGQGIVPFRKAFRKLAELQFTGPIMLEMWNDNSKDSIQIVKNARNWIVNEMAQSDPRPDDRSASIA